MAQSTQTDGGFEIVTPPVGAAGAPANLEALLAEHSACVQSPVPSVTSCENHLVEVRLGIASSLFAAIRHKHAPTAAHSLRVALGCSTWALAFGLDAQQRDELEVAALLHDIGKIGAPDRLLFKPGVLAREELKLIDQYRRTGLNILLNCCDSPG